MYNIRIMLCAYVSLSYDECQKTFFNSEVIVTPSCRHDKPEGAIYCPQCGKKIENISSAPIYTRKTGVFTEFDGDWQIPVVAFALGDHTNTNSYWKYDDHPYDHYTDRPDVGETCAVLHDETHKRYYCILVHTEACTDTHYEAWTCGVTLYHNEDEGIRNLGRCYSEDATPDELDPSKFAKDGAKLIKILSSFKDVNDLYYSVGVFPDLPRVACEEWYY